MKTVKDIRNEFLGFFEKNGHEVVDSSPLVPQNDPTLMFTNAGMVQFKNVFTGVEHRDYDRATTSQKCVRAGGKHNDLENVGYTARHHTFFEMLGNFSFGDYFKEEAINFAWDLVTKNFGMPVDKLLITVHSTDEEAAELWKKIAGLSDDKIIRIPTDDNFWSMGDTGPCGPCSEIFYDQGEALEGGPPGSPEEDGDRFLEFWNLVFMQYEQLESGDRVELPKPSIDTGMGLERMAALIQGKVTNYDIDLLSDIIDHSVELTGVAYGGDQAPSHRVIADHLRASAFLIADGVLPSNEGRGYVLRRIMRRGMRHAHLLGAEDPLLYRLLPTLISKMGEAYPELHRAEALTSETLKLEEERFKITLEKGLKLLEEETDKVKNNVLPGDVAFKLYDTYGFPLDLTQDALKPQGISVDTDAFDQCMAEQKAKARAAWSGSGGVADERIWFDILDEVGPTEFLGYDSEKREGVVKAIIKGGKKVEQVTAREGNKAREEAYIVTNQTPFYGESGGQVGDRGHFIVDKDNQALVIDTQKRLGKLWIHDCQMTKGTIKVGDTIKMEVDHDRRTAIRANHSATHLLHEALRQVLGEHVTQKGSLQDADRTRFDISHPKGITADELAQVEEIVNKEIQAGNDVVTRVMPIEEARETGAMALFGEKYDDEVRVVFMGSKDGNKQFSVELCGGTHVKALNEIGRLKITSESALSSGVRRVEAVTGERADAYEERKEQAVAQELDKLKSEYETLLSELESLGVTAENTPLTSVEDIQKAKKDLEKKISEARRNSALSDNDAKSESKTVGAYKFSAKVLEEFPPKDLKPLADELKKQLGSGVVVLVATNDGKASIVVGVTDDLTDQVNAVDLVRIGSEALGGKGGGGRPDMAQAGGPNADAANDALSAIEKNLAG